MGAFHGDRSGTGLRPCDTLGVVWWKGSLVDSGPPNWSHESVGRPSRSITVVTILSDGDFS